MTMRMSYKVDIVGAEGMSEVADRLERENFTIRQVFQEQPNSPQPRYVVFSQSIEETLARATRRAGRTGRKSQAKD